MLSSPRRPSSTMRIFSSAENFRRVMRRMSFTIFSAGSFTGPKRPSCLALNFKTAFCIGPYFQGGSCADQSTGFEHTILNIQSSQIPSSARTFHLKNHFKLKGETFSSPRRVLFRRCLPQLGNPCIKPCQVLLPLYLIGVLLHQLSNNGTARGECVASFRRFLGLAIHPGELCVADREIALPAGIAGVGFGQTLCNGEAVGIGFERGGKIALRLLHTADRLVGDIKCRLG